MRIPLLALTLALLLATNLAACSAKDEAAQQPVPDQAAQAAPAAEDKPAADADKTPTSTRVVREVVPQGPLGQVQLRNGTTFKIDALQKLGGEYWVYVTGKLNGRSSTVVSLTRFRDLMSWQSVVFKDPHTFTITNRQGKEWSFEDANFYMGSDKPDTYAFFVVNDRLDQVLTEVDKSAVSNIDFVVK